MSLHGDLLEQARRLLELDDRRPKQATLRRAVSTAYYALFHMLAAEVSARLFSDQTLRNLTSRALVHVEMKTVSEHFIQDPHKPRSKKSMQVFPGAIPPELSDVAKTFVELQKERHHADYKIDHRLTKNEVKTLISRVEQAIVKWQAVRGTDAANAYLASLLLWNRWKEEV